MFRSWDMEIPEAMLKLFQLQQTLHLEEPMAQSFCRTFDLCIVFLIPLQQDCSGRKRGPLSFVRLPFSISFQMGCLKET